MWQNDSTYQGNAQNTEFYFNSPLVLWAEDYDEYEHTWTHLSEELKSKLSNQLKEINSSRDLELPRPNDLTSYDNSDYIWLSCQLENMRQLCNMAVRDTETGKVLPGQGQIPYIQLRLQALAYSPNSRYPKSRLNAYDFEYKPHFVVEFEKPFLDAFMKFIFSIFDDNPQQFIDMPEGKRIVFYQHKAPIYRHTVFDKYFATRHDLPGTIFSKSIQMLLAHEMAHVGFGHLDLQAVDKEFGLKEDTLIVEEQQADIQAICWVLGERFLEMENNILEITQNDLFQELSIAIFSVYMLFTWDYSKKERIWSEDTKKKFGRGDHLPYQLRAYNMLNASLDRLIHLGEWSKEVGIRSKDGILLNVDFMQSVFDEAIEMIYAFEKAYHVFFANTENIYKLALETNTKELLNMIKSETQSEIPELTKENIPWLLGYEPEAQKELKRVHDLSEEVINRLKENGTYWRVDEFVPWSDCNDY